MRAVTVTRPGNAGVLETADRERPTAGPGQVLVRVGAAGVNYMDIYQRAGTAPLPTPFVAGVEGAGEVVAVRQGVTDPAKGPRVAWLSRGQGSYAEYVAVDAAKAVPVLQVVQEAGRVYVADAQFLLDRGCGSGLPRYDQLSGPGEQTTGREHQAPDRARRAPLTAWNILRTWDYAFSSDFFFGCRETVVSLLRCPYTVERGTPNRSAICWTVLTRAS